MAVGLGAIAALAALVTGITLKCKKKKSEYVVALTRKCSLDSEVTNTYLTPRMLNDPDFEDDTEQAVLYDHLELDCIEGRPLPDIPGTPPAATEES